MGSVIGATLGADTRDGSAMVSLHWKNVLRRLVTASSWELQVTAVTFVIEYVSIDMA